MAMMFYGFGKVINGIGRIAAVLLDECRQRCNRFSSSSHNTVYGNKRTDYAFDFQTKVFIATVSYSTCLVGAVQAIVRIGATRFTTYATMVASAASLLQFAARSSGAMLAA